MPQRMRAEWRSDAGFTLVEMLITIMVLGMLAGIVVFGVSRFRSDTASATCEADLKIVRSAASAYELRRGNYPDTLDVLEAEGLVKDPAEGVTYDFDTTAHTVELKACER